MKWLLGVVVIGALCGVVLWRESRKDRKVTEKDIIYTRIIGTESQKSTFSAIIRCFIGILICEIICELFLDASASMVDTLLSGLIGTMTAKNKDKTIFLIKYSDSTDFAIAKIYNDSYEFGRLCCYLKE